MLSILLEQIQNSKITSVAIALLLVYIFAQSAVFEFRIRLIGKVRLVYINFGILLLYLLS